MLIKRLTLCDTSFLIDKFVNCNLTAFMGDHTNKYRPIIGKVK